MTSNPLPGERKVNWGRTTDEGLQRETDGIAVRRRSTAIVNAPEATPLSDNTTLRPTSGTTGGGVGPEQAFGVCRRSHEQPERDSFANI